MRSFTENVRLTMRRYFTYKGGKIVEGRAEPLPQTDSRCFTRAPLHFTMQQAEPWTPGAPRYNKDGEPQFQSYREIREFEATSEGHWKYNEM